jgi:hypothetical protein
MKRLRSKLTYPNVISTLCLFLLVGGGTAYAASEMLPKGSVGTKQIQKEAVTPAKLSKTSKAALTGPNGAIGATGATGPQGPKGDAGPKGDSGTLAAFAIEDVSAVSENNGAKEKEVSVTCLSGKVLGGGYVLNSHNNLNIELRAVRSYAAAEGTWLVRALNSGIEEAWELSVVGVCVK